MMKIKQSKFYQIVGRMKEDAHVKRISSTFCFDF